MRFSFLALSLLGSFLLVNCGKPAKEPVTTTRMDAKTSFIFFHKEAIALLAIKHEIPQKVAESIFWDYSVKHDSMAKVFSETENGSKSALDPFTLYDSIDETVSSISREYDVPAKLVAAFIFDVHLLEDDSD